MGSGKSVTGQALAARFRCSFVDLDSEIEKKEGLAISEIFVQKGEPYFRDVENVILKEGRTANELQAFKPSLKEEGYYVFEYYVLRK